MISHSFGVQSSYIFRYAIVVTVVWTGLVVSSLIWNVDNLRDRAVFLATSEARSNWNKDQAFRRWATRHGGLYVVPNERTPPNPYLSHLPNRDVETTDGVLLTLMNPAYMMRQMTSEFEELFGVKGKITGQVLLNPLNEADPWELKALRAFDEGATEVVEMAAIEGAPYLRMMRPMIMQKGCVLCHGKLGFKEGDIRGGVSVSIPMTPYLEADENGKHALIATHAGIWLIGFIGIGFMSLWGRRRVMERRETGNKLQESENRFKDFADSAADWLWEMGPDLRFSYMSQRVEDVTGVPVDFHIGKTRKELAGDSIHLPNWQQHLDDLENHRPFKEFQYVRIGHDGRQQHISTSGVPVFSGTGVFMGYRGTGRDVTSETEAVQVLR